MDAAEIRMHESDDGDDDMSQDARSDQTSSDEAPIRSKHELDEPPPAACIRDIPADAQICLVGSVSGIVGLTAVVQAIHSGAQKALDAGTLLVTHDRQPLGLIAETLGPVALPVYSVRFGSPRDLARTSVGARVYAVQQNCVWVHTGALASVRGCDASDAYDEELCASLQEFSDDDQERRTKWAAKRKHK